MIKDSKGKIYCKSCNSNDNKDTQHLHPQTVVNKPSHIFHFLIQIFSDSFNQFNFLTWLSDKLFLQNILLEQVTLTDMKRIVEKKTSLSLDNSKITCLMFS